MWINDCWINVLSSLSIKDLFSFSLVNKEGKRNVDRDGLWKILCFRDFYFLPYGSNKSWKEIYKIQVETGKFLSRSCGPIKKYIILPDSFYPLKLEGKEDMKRLFIENMSGMKLADFLLKTVKAEKGDIISVQYLNLIKFIFNGEKFVMVNYKNKDPLLEAIKSFPINYWRKEHIFESYFNLFPFADELVKSQEVICVENNKIRILGRENVKYEGNIYLVRSRFVYNDYVYFVHVVPRVIHYPNIVNFEGILNLKEEVYRKTSLTIVKII